MTNTKMKATAIRELNDIKASRSSIVAKIVGTIASYAADGKDIAILHDVDLDGYTSSAILSLMATTANDDATVLTLGVPHGSTSIDRLKRLLADRSGDSQLTIVLDLALTAEVYDEIVGRNTQVIWVDHHPVAGALEDFQSFDPERAMFLIDEAGGLSTTGLCNLIYLTHIRSVMIEQYPLITKCTLKDEIERFSKKERVVIRSSFIDLVNHFDTGLAMTDPGARISIMARALNSAFWGERDELLARIHTLFSLGSEKLPSDDGALDWLKKTYQPYDSQLSELKKANDALYELIRKHIETIGRVRDDYESSISKHVIKLKIKPASIDESYPEALKPEISIAMVMHSSHVEEIAIAILEEHPDVDAAAVTYVKGRDGQVIRKTSLRGRNTPGVNLSVLAKILGNGGGHANAAGYETVIVAPMVDIGKLAT